MSDAFYRSGQAAKVWDISSHLVRRLCEAGLVEAKLTGGGQWKIPYSEVERIKKEGIPEIPSSIESDYAKAEDEQDNPPGNGLLAPPSDATEQVVLAENPLKKLKIDKDAEKTRDWSRERQRYAEETESRERHAALDKAACAQAEQDRVVWQDSWLAAALLSLPREAPAEIRLAVHETVAEALENLGPRHSRQVIEPLVTAAVAKALRPWNQARETASAVERACDVLPWGAKNSFSPTVWQARAHEMAAAAIRKLPSDSNYDEKLRVGSAAVRQITSEFEDDELRKRILQEAYLWDISPEEREDAKEAVQGKLKSLPIGAPVRTMERARDQALAPFRDAKKRKERVDRALGRTRRYLEQLYQEGETDFESGWEVWNFAKKLEGRLRPVLLEELQNDDLSDDELSELAEELVDEELE